MVISREDLLKESEYDVDSTTEDSPVKKPKPAHAKKADTKSQKKAKIVAAKKRAKEIFATSSYPISSDSDSGAESEVKELKRELAQLKRQLKSPKTPTSMCKPTSCV